MSNRSPTHPDSTIHVEVEYGTVRMSSYDTVGDPICEFHMDPVSATTLARHLDKASELGFRWGHDHA